MHSSGKCFNQGMWTLLNSPFSYMVLSVCYKPAQWVEGGKRETERGRPSRKAAFYVPNNWRCLTPATTLYSEKLSIPASYFVHATNKQTSYLRPMCHPMQVYGLEKEQYFAPVGGFVCLRSSRIYLKMCVIYERIPSSSRREWCVFTMSTGFFPTSRPRMAPGWLHFVRNPVCRWYSWFLPPLDLCQ